MRISFYKQWARYYDFLWRGYTNQTLTHILKALDLKRLSQLEEQPQPRRLLDIACGSGELALRLSRRHPTLQVTGLDYSSQMLEQARQKLSGSAKMLLVQADASAALPFADASFEVVVSANALHYLAAPDRLLQEIGRVLKPGGQLVIEDFTVHGRRFWPLFELLILKRLDQQHYRTYLLDELSGLMTGANYIIVASYNFRLNLFWRGMLVSSVKQQ